MDTFTCFIMYKKNLADPSRNASTTADDPWCTRDRSNTVYNSLTDVPMRSRYMPNRVRKCLCKVRTLKIESRSLNKPRRILFKIFWREILLKSPNEPCIKI